MFVAEASACGVPFARTGSKWTPGKHDVSSSSLIRAAFAGLDSAGAVETGLKRDTVRRAIVVCAEALTARQESRARRLMDGLAGGFVVLKRSWDETPFWMKDPKTLENIPLKILNQRIFFRWSKGEAILLLLLLLLFI